MLLKVVKYGNAAFMYAANAVTLPLVNVLGTSSFIMGVNHAQPLNMYTVGGLVAMLAGLALWSNALWSNDKPKSGASVSQSLARVCTVYTLSHVMLSTLPLCRLLGPCSVRDGGQLHGKPPGEYRARPRPLTPCPRLDGTAAWVVLTPGCVVAWAWQVPLLSRVSAPSCLPTYSTPPSPSPCSLPPLHMPCHQPDPTAWTVTVAHMGCCCWRCTSQCLPGHAA